MITSLHNHSTWSDGQASVKQMLAMAGELEIDELGISDHLVLRPGGETPFWSIPPGRLDTYVDELLRHRSAAGPMIRIGVEVDWFPKQGEAINEVLHGLPFDFVIGSVHEVDGFIVDVSADAWRGLSVDRQNRVYRHYWQQLCSLAECGLFDVVGHLDLAKKFGFQPSIDLEREIDAALDAIARSGMAVELNTAGWHFPCQEAYPSPRLLEQCRERGIPMMLTADAHEAGHLLRDFNRGTEQLLAAGYAQTVRFDNREKIFTELRSFIS